jgi:predicted nucleotidyltransferase
LNCARIARHTQEILIHTREKVAGVVYTIEQLKEKITPVARKYGLTTVYIFGSYARGEATDTSDVDILVDKTDARLHGLFAMGGLYNDLSEAVQKPIDLITTSALEQESAKQRTPWMIENLNGERIRIYG